MSTLREALNDYKYHLGPGVVRCHIVFMGIITLELQKVHAS